MLPLKLLLSSMGLVGVLISLFNLPGILLVFGAFGILYFVSDFTAISSTEMIIVTVLTISTLLADNVLTMVGAKKHGASSKGVIGAFVGGLVGLVLLGPVGIIVGPVVGAMGMEYFANPDLKKAFRAGFGTFMGYLAGYVLRVIITVSLFLWLLIILF